MFINQLMIGIHGCNICHREPMLEKLLLGKRGASKLTDFSMALAMCSDDLLRRCCGSPRYICPRMVQGDMYKGHSCRCVESGRDHTRIGHLKPPFHQRLLALVVW